jgi:hypothetical protein
MVKKWKNMTASELEIERKVLTVMTFLVWVGSSVVCLLLCALLPVNQKLAVFGILGVGLAFVSLFVTIVMRISMEIRIREIKERLGLA